MLVFPNCKINLGLNIIRKRDDGFHDLETVFYPVALNDCLEIIVSENKELAVEYSSSGLAIDGATENNLCIKAYHLLKKDLPQLPSIKMHLHKAIPMGAGLGGGSADGAFALHLLNDKFRLGLSTEQLLSYAAALGSDGPFFIINKPCFATGRGEVLEEINIDLSAYQIVLVNPNIHVNTGWAFTQLTPAVPQDSIKKIIQQPVDTWKDMLQNDFEKPVFAVHSEIKAIKEKLYSLGAVYAAMSGSGSTVFGLFEKEKKVEFDFPSEYFIKII
jgi:4-diphosphocytidyl-2-C-methyl-D-erythritol kinase